MQHMRAMPQARGKSSDCIQGARYRQEESQRSLSRSRLMLPLDPPDWYWEGYEFKPAHWPAQEPLSDDDEEEED